MARSQISSEVSEDVRQKLDRFTRARGLKKGYVLEQALVSYMLAAEELPADLVIPGRIVISDKSFAVITSQIAQPSAPSPALIALMAGDDHAVDDSALE